MIISRSENRFLGLNEGTDLMNKEEDESFDRFGGYPNDWLCLWSWQCQSQWCDCGKKCRKVIKGVKQGDTGCL